MTIKKGDEVTIPGVVEKVRTEGGWQQVRVRTEDRVLLPWVGSDTVKAIEEPPVEPPVPEPEPPATSPNELPVIWRMPESEGRLRELIGSKSGWGIATVDTRPVLIARHRAGSLMPQDIKVALPGGIRVGRARWKQRFGAGYLRPKQKNCGFTDNNGPANVHPNTSGHISFKLEMGWWQDQATAKYPGRIGADCYHFGQPTNEAAEVRGTFTFAEDRDYEMELFVDAETGVGRIYADGVPVLEGKADWRDSRFTVFVVGGYPGGSWGSDVDAASVIWDVVISGK